MRAIEVDGLTKIYRLYNSPKDRLKELISPGGKKYHREFYALRDLSLRVETGETIGIIGENGSGKSTLLKILTGIIRPTSGTVSVNGRVSSLLELGAGFNPEFTGRDNVYMNGALLGFSRKEMDRRFPEIASFADIGEFIEQPVRTYSSGMYMRLAFSAAVNIDPDILIVDEILSVGDEDFQSKCRQKIQDLRKRGKTVLLVSHDMFTVENICSRTYLLDHGARVTEGKPRDVISTYQKLLRAKSGRPPGKSGRIDEARSTGAESPDRVKRWGTKDIEITNVTFTNGQDVELKQLKVAPQESLAIRIEYVASQRVDRPVFGISIQREDGADINRSNTRMSHFDIPYVSGKGAIEYAVDSLPLMPGTFRLTVGVCDHDLFTPYNFWEGCLDLVVEKAGVGEEQFGLVPLAGRWRLLG